MWILFLSAQVAKTKGEPQPLGERQAGHEIFIAEKPHWDHWSYQHLGPVSVSDSCATFDKLSLPPGLCFITGKTGMRFSL